MTASYAVDALPGIKSTDDDLMSHSLTIVFDDTKSSIEKIREALIKADHRVEGDAEILHKK